MQVGSPLPHAGDRRVPSRGKTPRRAASEYAPRSVFACAGTAREAWPVRSASVGTDRPKSLLVSGWKPTEWTEWNATRDSDDGSDQPLVLMKLVRTPSN